MRGVSVHGVINDEKLFPRVLHDILAYVANEKLDVGWQSVGIFCRNRDFMLVLVAKQHFKASTVDAVSPPGLQMPILDSYVNSTLI
jgi:hypothetical protein